MEQRDIISMLNYPDRPLVDYAVSLANLTLPEQEAITMRVYNGETVESTAERLMLSPGGGALPCAYYYSGNGNNHADS